MDNQGFGEVLIKYRFRDGKRIVEWHAKTRIKVKVEMVDDVLGTISEYSVKDVKRHTDCNTHNQQVLRFNTLIANVNNELNKFGDISAIPQGWLQGYIDEQVCPNKKNKSVQDKQNNIYDMFVDFLKAKQFSNSYHKGCLCLIRAIWRYECFQKANKGKRYSVNIQSLKRADIENFRDYLLTENQLFGEYPMIFAQAIATYPDGIKGGRGKVLPKGGNAVYHLLKKLSNFYQWL